MSTTQPKPDKTVFSETKQVWFLILDPFSDPGYLLISGPPPEDLSEFLLECAETGDLTMLRLHGDPRRVETRECSGWEHFVKSSWEKFREHSETYRAWEETRNES